MSKRGHEDDKQSKLQKNDMGLKVVDDSEYCPICQDVLGHENIFTTNCLHKFHNECINTWTQKPESQPKDHDKTQFRCPLCNQSTPRRGVSQQLPPQQSVNNPRFNRMMDFFRNQREEYGYQREQDRIFASADELHAGLQAASLHRKENRQSRRDAGEGNVEEDTPPVVSDDTSDDDFLLLNGGKSRKGLRKNNLRKNNRRKTRKVKRRKSKKR